MAARQLRNLPITALAAALAAAAQVVGAAAAEPPARHLESRRASAPVVYLATVTGVADAGDPAEPVETVRTLQASLKVERVFRPASPSPALPSPAPPSPAPSEVTVRFRTAGAGDEDLPAELFYELSAGDRVVVFAPSFDPSFAIELIAGSTKEVAAQVSALRAQVAAMDETAAQLHGVTAAVRARQAALYDRVLAALRAASAP